MNQRAITGLVILMLGSFAQLGGCSSIVGPRVDATASDDVVLSDGSMSDAGGLRGIYQAYISVGFSDVSIPLESGTASGYFMDFAIRANSVGELVMVDEPMSTYVTERRLPDGGWRRPCDVPLREVSPNRAVFVSGTVCRSLAEGIGSDEVLEGEITVSGDSVMLRWRSLVTWFAPEGAVTGIWLQRGNGTRQ